MMGSSWKWSEKSVNEAWLDIRLAFRILHCAAAVRLFFNGLSLWCQYRFPHRMFRGHGNEQLFYRGAVQATGVPINVLRFVLKLTLLAGTDFQRSTVEITANLLRCVVTSVSSASLFNQWWMTGKGATGHPTSDAWERLVDPDIHCPRERIRVTIVSAQGLRNADWTGKSDPYCTVMVPSKPQSKFKTQVINDTLNPVWNEVHEMPEYRRNDMLKFAVDDYDDKEGCCSCNWNDDFLGGLTVHSDQFHPNGFEGDLPLKECGRGKHATLKIKIEVLEVLPEEARSNPFGRFSGSPDMPRSSDKTTPPVPSNPESKQDSTSPADDQSAPPGQRLPEETMTPAGEKTQV